MTRSRQFECSVLLLGILAGIAHAADPEAFKWTIDGTERSAFLFKPTSPPKSGGSPLVFAFHGHGGNVHQFARRANFQTLWPEAIVVYMQGIPTATTVDPEGKRSGWQRNAGELGDRDVKFFDQVLATIREKHEVDDKRIYATGNSNGAFFVYVLWAERPDTFAAFAPCIGLPWPTLRLTAPKPVFIVAGKKDNLVPFDKQQIAIDRIRKLNSATAAGKTQTDGTTRYSSEDGAPVVTLIHPGGHGVPPEASELIVEFFRAHDCR